MPIKNVLNFIRGSLENSGAERRIPDNGLTKLHNVDITDDGRLVRRRGYNYWGDLVSNSSVSGGVPNTDRGGFGKRIQAIKSWTDVAGNEYIFVVCDGKVYVESYDQGTKRWTCLNPTGNIELFEKEKHIDIVSYLDVVFINDVGKNVYMYNSANYTSGGYNVLGARFIYFAGNKIYFRKQSSYEADDTVLIEDNVSNLTGKIIFDGLKNIGYIGVTGVVSSAADLKLGYSLRIGNDDFGYSYIVIDNAKNQRGNDMVYLIKFNDRFIAQDYIGVQMDHNGEILSFAHRYDNVEYKDYVYLFARDGEIDVIDVDNFVSTVLDSETGAGAMVAPTVQSGKKQYSICLNGNGLFVYTSKVPALTDWWQPLMIGSVDFNDAQPNFPGFPDLGASDPTNLLKLIFGKEIVGGSNLWIDEKLYDRHIGSGNYYSNILTAPPSGVLNKEYSYFAFYNPYTSRWSFYSGTQIFNPYYPNVITSIDGLHWLYPDSGPTIYSTCNNTYAHYDMHYGIFLKSGWDTLRSGVKIFDIKNILQSEIVSAYDIYAADHKETISISLLEVIAGGYFEGSNQVANPQFSFTPGGTLGSYKLGKFSTSSGYWKRAFESTQNWVWVLKTDSRIVSIEDRYIKLIKEHSTFTLSDKKIILDSNFTNDKSSSSIEKQLFSVSGTDLVPSHLMLDGDDAYDSLVFSDIQTSKHSLLAGLTLTGELLERSLSGFITGTHKWRYLFPIGKISDTVNLVPIQSYGNKIYFGSSMEQVAGEDHGIYIDLDLTTLEYNTESMNTSCRKLIVDDARELLFFMQGDPDVSGDLARFRFNSTWDWATALNLFTDFTDLLDFNSNVTYAIVKQSAGLIGKDTIDRLQYVGTPKAPFVTIDNGPVTNLLKGTKFIYQTAFKFTSGKTTVLSGDSEELSIPDVGDDPQPVKMVVSGLDHLNVLGVELYDKDDIDQIQVYRRQLNPGATLWSDPLLVGFLTKDTGTKKWYVGGDLHTYPEGTIEDSNQSLAYSPFTQGNVLTYAAEDIVVHKGRLVLVGLTDELNRSVIGFSDQDLAEAISPGNARAIESGDGDKLYAGESCGDYFYIFKGKKVYAILGDVYDGQLINVSGTVGCRNKNLITQYGDTVYFIDDSGPYMIRGVQCVPLMHESVRNYFDPYRDDSIDFSSLKDNGFAVVDVNKLEVRFHVPTKVDGRDQSQNNHVLIYNIRYGYWKSYSYAHPVFVEAPIKDIASFAYKSLVSNYEGDIYEISAQKNDAGKPVQFIIRTKDFNLDTDLIAKTYRFIKVYGKNIRGMKVTYWVDGERKLGDVSWSPGMQDEAMVNVWKRGRCNTIMIEISGYHQNEAPFELNEFMIGYSPLAGIR